MRVCERWVRVVGRGDVRRCASERYARYAARRWGGRAEQCGGELYAESAYEYEYRGSLSDCSCWSGSDYFAGIDVRCRRCGEVDARYDIDDLERLVSEI